MDFYTRDTINTMNTQIAIIDFPCPGEIVLHQCNSTSSLSSIIILRDVKKKQK